jgi:hypothetical protein
MRHEAFVYDAEQDVYRCPAGQLPTPSAGRKINTGGRIEIRYTSRKADCDGCPLRARCLCAKTPTRTVHRWEPEAVLERHRVRMQDAKAQWRRRSALAEHPFGTLKCRAGYRHFRVRGLNTVRGEWSLMALCDNFSRVRTLGGLKELIAYFVKRAEASSFFGLSGVLNVAIGRTRALLAHVRVAITQNWAASRLRFKLAA